MALPSADLDWVDMTSFYEAKQRDYILKDSLCACIENVALSGNCWICNDNTQIQNDYAYQQNKQILGW
ncbi:hypothetical protein EFB08_21430 [Rufibacter latericius]|uniref:Uncharacterized protein n=2 Tax=Rufibacter latericius TaxID=2487040 RepID=A0A3M9MDI0_9BACT|nr:hypothetical protein EFB08_21430 [Rufibacter latericius]